MSEHGAEKDAPISLRSHLTVDGMAWPNPADPRDVQWRLRYGAVSREDLLVAASFMHAYAHLIDMTQRERNERVRQIRAAQTRVIPSGSSAS